jgi:hypothetical protein
VALLSSIFAQDTILISPRFYAVLQHEGIEGRERLGHRSLLDHLIRPL